MRTDIITSTADSYDHTADQTTKELSRYSSGSTSNEGGLFAKGEYRSKRLSFSAGVRAMGFWLDIQDRADSPAFERTLLDYSAELGVRVLIFSPLAFVVNAGRGVRMPNVADFSALGPRAQGRYQVPNAHIGAEHSWTVDGGLKMRSKGWILDTFVFATRYDDAITLLPTRVAGQEFTAEGERYYHSENAARVDYIGLDVSGAVPLGRAARLWGRWLALLGQQTNPPDSTAPRRTAADRVPPAQGELGVEVELWGRWTFKTWSRFRLKQDRLNDPTNLDDNRIPEGWTPGYITLHAQAEFAMRPGLEALLSLDNLTNALVLDHGSGFFGPGFAATLGLRFDGNFASPVEHDTHE